MWVMGQHRPLFTVCFVLSLFAFLILFCHGYPTPLLQKWLCEGCGSESHRLRIFGAIHRAMHAENRFVYYPFNYEWIDHMRRSSSVVRVIVIERDHIAKYHPKRETEYEIIYVHVPRSTFSSAGVGANNVYMEPHSQQIDSFLTLNPCWVPLHEPCAFNCSHFNFHNEEMQLYGESTVLIRLSGMYNDTCKLFEALVKRQFPQECTYDDDHMRIGHPHNIGWSNTVHTIQGYLLDTLRQGHTHKVLVLPRAHSFDGQHQDFRLANGTLYHRDRSRWYWANPLTCPEETILFDPWACNFLSLTNCSTRESVLDIPTESEGHLSGDFGSFLSSLGISAESRVETGDHPYLDQ